MTESVKAPLRILLAMLCCGLLGLAVSACSNGEPDKTLPTQTDMKDSIIREPEWSKIPALRRIPVSSDLFLAHSVRPPMPMDVANRKISLRFNKGDATLHDLIGILDSQSVSLVLRSSGDTGLSEEDIGDLVLPFRRYDGTVAGLAKKLGNSLNLAVWWENDSLYISDRDRYVISVPQNQQVIDNVIKELEDFGAEDVTPSMYGGRIVYSVRPAVNDELIKPYLNGLIGNLAEITLQLAVVQVNLTDASGRGIDWSAMQVQFGNPAKALANATTAGTAVGVLGTSQGASVSATGVSDITSGTTSTTGEILGSLKTNVAPNSTVGVSGAILYLSQYGKTTTQQMVELRTLAGMKVQLQSLHTTPYLKGFSSTGSTQGSNNVTSSTDTSSVDTGLSMNFTPYYDSILGLVSVNVNIQVSSLIALRQLPIPNTNSSSSSTTTGSTSSSGSTGTTGTGSSNSATGQFILQPETEKNQITDIVRLPAGEVIILGGLKEDSKQDTEQSPFGLYDSLGSKKTNNTTTLTFFIMRPVVTIFDPKGAKVNTTLPGDPSDFSDRAFHDDTEANPVTVIEPTTLPPSRRHDMEDDAVPMEPVIPPAKNNAPKPTIIKPQTSLSPVMPNTDKNADRAEFEDAPPLITQIQSIFGPADADTPPPGKANGGP